MFQVWKPRSQDLGFESLFWRWVIEQYNLFHVLPINLRDNIVNLRWTCLASCEVARCALGCFWTAEISSRPLSIRTHEATPNIDIDFNFWHKAGEFKGRVILLNGSRCWIGICLIDLEMIKDKIDLSRLWAQNVKMDEMLLSHFFLLVRDTLHLTPYHRY